MLLKNNKVDKAIDVLNEFRPNNEHFAKEEERINNEIQRLQEKDLFQKELQLSEMGNLQSIKYIADTYYHGNSFVKTDHNKALEYYEIYYEKTHDNETKKIINELVPSYRTGDYEFVKTKNIPSVDIDGNVIYYLINYYSTKSVEISRLEDRNDYKERAHDAIIAVKNSHYVENHSNYTRYFDFPKYVCNFINMLEGKWIICTVPGHKQSLNFTNGTIEVFDLIDIEGTNFTIRNTVIWRNKWVNKKATSFHGRRCMDYKKEMESLSIENGYDVRGKNFIIVDDITTSGTSLIACRNLLLDAGANKCILLAYGKTKEN
jgi:phosphoribosylpyrophosphate synthetase